LGLDGFIQAATQEQQNQRKQTIMHRSSAKEQEPVTDGNRSGKEASFPGTRLNFGGNGPEPDL
jgi:hypothetical protein